jgi:hypothetical protein
MAYLRREPLKLAAALGTGALACVLLLVLVLSRASAPQLGGVASRAGVSAGPTASTPQRIAMLQHALRAGDGGASTYAQLGDAYLQRARETGDPSFYTRADGAYSSGLRRDGDDIGSLIGAGTLANARHDFVRGLHLGRRAHTVEPRLARPYTVIFDSQVELGRYPQAARTAQHLVDVKPGLASYARASYYRELRGDLPGAVQAMGWPRRPAPARQRTGPRPGSPGRPRA